MDHPFYQNLHKKQDEDEFEKSLSNKVIKDITKKVNNKNH